MEKRDYVITLSRHINEIAHKRAKLFGCEFPAPGPVPGTTLWFSDPRDAKFAEIMCDGSRNFCNCQIPDLATWLGILELRGFTHVSIRGDWTSMWEKRRPIGAWLLKPCKVCGFQSFDWRLYRSANQPWSMSVTVKFENGVPVVIPPGMQFPAWSQPIHRRAPRRRPTN